MRHLVLAAILLASTAAMAQPAIAVKDKQFLDNQAQGTAFELAIAKLASEKAQRADVKAYAAMIVADHVQLNTDLAKLAASKGVTLPTDMSGSDHTELLRLQGLQGEAFDKAYVQYTVKVNDSGVKQDRAEIEETVDPAMKSFTEALQASDQRHRDAGERLAQQKP